jgi:hypothetical protein
MACPQMGIPRDTPRQAADGSGDRFDPVSYPLAGGANRFRVRRPKRMNSQSGG